MPSPGPADVVIHFSEDTGAEHDAAVKRREVLLPRVRGLAESAMRSTREVRFAEVAVSQAQLDLYRAENNAEEAQAITAAMGLEETEQFEAQDEPVTGPRRAAMSQLLAGAFARRP
jgi:hypothetical protein